MRWYSLNPPFGHCCGNNSQGLFLNPQRRQESPPPLSAPLSFPSLLSSTSHPLPSVSPILHPPLLLPLANVGQGELQSCSNLIPTRLRGELDSEGTAASNGSSKQVLCWCLVLHVFPTNLGASEGQGNPLATISVPDKAQFLAQQPLAASPAVGRAKAARTVAAAGRSRDVSKVDQRWMGEEERCCSAQKGREGCQGGGGDGILT